MNWELSHKLVQCTAALLAIPVAMAGGYSLYHNHLSSKGVCESLRDKVLMVVDRSLAPSVKYVLVHREVEQFETKCAELDPDITAIFNATVAQLHAATSAEASRSEHPKGNPGAAHYTSVVATAAAPSAPAAPIFGLSATGEKRGWVALSRRDNGHVGESNFDGFADGQTTAPAVGSRLSARRYVPVWLEAQKPGPTNSSRLQGRPGRGACVDVLATWAGPVRLWAEVAPVACQQAANGTQQP